MTASFKLEVCCFSLESAVAAQEGGAHRIELCENSYEGGTTPGFGLLKRAREKLQIGLFVMIRPRGGDFLYSPDEIKVMLYDIANARDLGADGVVLGALQSDGFLDLDNMKLLIEEARGLQVTLHRAFDLTPDPLRTLREAVDLGVNSILTSGQKPTAAEGIPLIRTMVELAGTSLRIMPGCGINEGNLWEILETGVREIHVSAKRTRTSAMTYRPQRVYMGDPRSGEFSWEVADAQRVKQYKKLMGEFAKKKG